LFGAGLLVLREFFRTCGDREVNITPGQLPTGAYGSHPSSQCSESDVNVRLDAMTMGGEIMSVVAVEKMTSEASASKRFWSIFWPFADSPS